MKRKFISKEKSLIATFFMIVAIICLFFFSYYQVNKLTQKQCLSRMSEDIDSIITEISNKINRDSSSLNSFADFLSQQEDLDVKSIQKTVTTLSSMLVTMKAFVLMPDNTVIEPIGTLAEGSGSLSFEELAPLGEHVSDRVASLFDKSAFVLRHYVPVVKDGETIAILYGVTPLADLPSFMSIRSIHSAKTDVYIIDMQTGDFIMDTSRDVLGNIRDYRVTRTKNRADWDAAVDGLLAGESRQLTFFSEDADEWLYFYYEPAEEIDNLWSIAVSVPEKEVFHNLYEIRGIFEVMALLIIGISLLYYFWVRENSKKTIARAVENAVLEEKLQKAVAAERAKTTFLSNMSHDIRTPMNAIIGFTSLAQANIDKKEKVQDYLAKILSSSNHLLSLINDILDMSRIESGKLNIEEKPCNLSDIFKDMRNIIMSQIQAKQLNFFLDTIDIIDEDIYCDKLHINQILLNLLGNAVKFTPAGGSISLTIRQKPGAPTGYGSYEFRVKDTGIGMSAEFAEHVFEPFEREKSSTVTGIQGTGLGMAITKNIVTAMGGTIEVATELGKGTEFIINLDFRLHTEHRGTEIIPELKGLRALVVDDSFSTCDSVTKMLVQIGMRSEWTLHGKEAVLRAKQAVEMGDEFYAYIIDWVLPDLSGIEVARQIRSAVGETIPIIILTAYDWSSFEEEAKEAGVTAFCNKPLFLSELRDLLVSVIGKAEPPAEDPAVPPITEDLKGRRLLLAEDNELNREIAEEILSESGFLIETASNGQIAVDMVKNAAPGYYDLILMDIQMPVMNGYDAARAIRGLENPDLANIPIVAMTANAFEEDQRTAFECGMNAHVAKPINIEALMETLSSLLHKSA